MKEMITNKEYEGNNSLSEVELVMQMVSEQKKNKEKARPGPGPGLKQRLYQHIESHPDRDEIIEKLSGMIEDEVVLIILSIVAQGHFATQTKVLQQDAKLQINIDACNQLIEQNERRISQAPAVTARFNKLEEKSNQIIKRLNYIQEQLDTKPKKKFWLF